MSRVWDDFIVLRFRIKTIPNKNSVGIVFHYLCKSIRLAHRLQSLPLNQSIIIMTASPSSITPVSRKPAL